MAAYDAVANVSDAAALNRSSARLPEEPVQPAETRASHLVNRVSSKLFERDSRGPDAHVAPKSVSYDIHPMQDSASRLFLNDARREVEAKRNLIPRQMSEWFSSVITPTPSTSSITAPLPPERADGSSLPDRMPAVIPRLQRSLGGLDRMIERAVNYFTDSDANADRCADDIWLIGGVSHRGWTSSILEMQSTSTSPGSPRRLRKNSTNASLVSDRSPPRHKLRSAIRKKRSRMAYRNAHHSSADVIDPPRSVSYNQTREAPLAPQQPPSPLHAEAPLFARVSSFTSSSTESSSSVATMAPLPINTSGWPPLFFADFNSRLQMTYRSGFEPIPYSHQPSLTKSFSMAMTSLTATLARNASISSTNGLTSDAGWGCMLRTGQSLLANALSIIHLGRDWRRTSVTMPDDITRENSPPAVAFGVYARLLSWFFDDPSPLCPFSVHRFALMGKQLGKEVGEWFGPSTAAGAIKSLTNAFAPAGLRVITAIDGTLYRSEVVAAAAYADTLVWSRPVLILVNLRLGIDGVHPIYHDSIKSLFNMPQLVGIAGGRPSSSYYFVGCQADALIYIDPHHTQPSVDMHMLPADLHAAGLSLPLVTPDASDSQGNRGCDPRAAELDQFFATAYTEADLHSFHCDRVRKMAIAGLDPSMLVGMLCTSASDFDDLCSRMSHLKTPLFGIADRMPGWARSVSGADNCRNVGNFPLSPTTDDAETTELSDDATFDEPDDVWAISDEEDEARPGASPDRTPVVDVASEPQKSYQAPPICAEDAVFVEPAIESRLTTSAAEAGWEGIHIAQRGGEGGEC